MYVRAVDVNFCNHCSNSAQPASIIMVRKANVNDGQPTSFGLLRSFWTNALSTVESIGAVRAVVVDGRKQRFDNHMRYVESHLLQQKRTTRDTWSWREVSFSEWLIWGSWGKCNQCGVFHKRAISQSELLHPVGVEKRLSKTCWSCAHGTHHYVTPSTQSWPTALKNLQDDVVYALRPVILHQGSPTKHRNGYMRKDCLSHLSWASSSVHDRIMALTDDSRRAGIRAYKWLMRNNKSYLAYVQKLDVVLVANGTKTLPPSALFESYLESALWPQLYPYHHWCESHTSAAEDWTEPFQLRNNHKPTPYESVKAAFMQKVCSEVPDYGGCYPLIQFQFDRYILKLVLNRTETAVNDDVMLTGRLADKHWTPAYWKDHHRVLLDVVRQLGMPAIFLTISPWEWSFPWPAWVSKAHAALGKSATEVPGCEAIAVAHALQQCVAGFLAGHTSGKPWTYHWLGDKSGKQNPVQSFFGRFEYQDGGESHEYGKGRGSLHMHCLFWFTDVRSVGLESLLMAELPSDDVEVETLAKLVQRSNDHDCAPVYEQSSTWDWCVRLGGWFLSLKKTQQFHDKKLRPFMTALLRIFRCNQDVQWWSSASPLLRYVAGYASKYQESWDENWVNSAGNTWAAALNVARYWKAGANEQMMVLSRLGMVSTNVHAILYNPLRFGSVEDDERQFYRLRSAASDDMTFLDFLRLHRIDNKKSCPTLVRHRTGFVAVGIRYAKFLSDDFFWQWLQMNRPFRCVHLLCPPAMWTVNEKHKAFAAALTLCPHTWDSDAWVQRYCRADGHKEDYVSTCVERMKALVFHVRQQMCGALPKFDAVSDRAVSVTLSAGQQSLASQIGISLRKSLEIEPGQAKTFFVTGGPGCGKTALVDHVIDQAIALGISVLRTSPTGKLVSACKRSDMIHNTTVCRAFGLPHNVFNDAVAMHGLWIVGEVGMLSKAHADCIWSHWLRCGRLPVLIFEGDMQQLPPGLHHESDVRQCSWWNSVRTWELKYSFRCSDRGLIEFLDEVRHGVPTSACLQSIFGDLVVSDELDKHSLLQAWKLLPDAVVLTATRAACRLVNDIGWAACKGDDLGTISVWAADANDDPVLVSLQLRRGMKLEITRNSAIDDTHFNGAPCVLLAFHPQGVQVQMYTGRIDILHMRAAWTQAVGGQSILKRAFDLGMAYASTVHKAEGLTLESAIICFENWTLPGWGYTAVSRLRSRSQLRCIGMPLPWHFQPREL